MAKNLLNKYDFRQEILSQGCDIEVLEPKWFRDEVAEISKHMWNTPEIIPTKEPAPPFSKEGPGDASKLPAY